jgi:hypothetical protein
MPDIVRRERRGRHRASAPEALTAAAKILNPTGVGRSTAEIQYSSWQDEAWSFFEAEGEYWYGVTWLAQALSRVKLVAAVEVPGGDEPEVISEGDAVDIVQSLGGGPGGQAAMMKAFGIHLQVPGKVWLVGEDLAAGIRKWSTKSAKELRQSSRGGYEILVDDGVWAPLVKDSLVVPIWDPDPQYSFKATSPAKSALACLRKIDLYNRTIVAKLVSRLALNGFFFMPSEATFPVKQEFKDQPDPFVAELVDIAARAIQNPGDARSALPIPLKVKSELIEKFRHMKVFEVEEFRELIEARDKEIVRLANMSNIPAEVMTGMGDVNHWTAWQLSEDAARIHVAPLAEIVCSGLTAGFLQPTLVAEGKPLTDSSGNRIVVWYDVSDLVAKPDRTQQANDARDRLTISDEAYRTLMGLDESMAPTPQQLKEMVLRDALKIAGLGAIAFEEITGIEVPTQAPVVGAPEAEPGGPGDGDGEEGPPPSEPAPATGPPNTQDEPPPTPGG